MKSRKVDLELLRKWMEETFGVTDLSRVSEINIRIRPYNASSVEVSYFILEDELAAFDVGHA